MGMAFERELAGGLRLRLHLQHSDVLAGNPLGDPTTRECPLLLPAGESGGLPLVILLVGFTGFGRKVCNVSMWQESVPERLARRMAAGEIPPCVILWPSCETRLGGSQYMNSSATGRYEDFLRDELVPTIEAEYGCGGAGLRFLAGKSSGGYGALTLAMRNPGWVTGIACHAGDMGFEFGYWREFPDALNVFRKHGGVAAFLEAARQGLPKIGTPEVHAFDLLGMASCYSPNPESEFGFDLPIDPQTGEPQQEVFERWLAHDPLRMIREPENVAALSRLKRLYLDAGERDEFALQWGLRRFLPRLREAGVEHRAEFFEGGHFDMDSRYEVSLPYLLDAAS